MDSPTQIENQTPKEKPVVISSEGNKTPSFKFSFVNPKILAGMTVLLLMVTGIGAGVYLIQQPQQTVTQATSATPVDLIFQPSEIQAEEGKEFNASVYASANNNQITSTDLVIEYPVTLTLKSISPGEFLPKILIPPSISEGSATISLGTEGTSGVSGNGVITTLTFQPNPGSANMPVQIKLGQGTKVSVFNREPGLVKDNIGVATVSIQAATPNPSMSPSQTPTPSISTTLSIPQDTPVSSSASAQPTSADFNNDGLTNSIDLSVLYSGWGTPENDTQKGADLNADGVINGIDYSLFLPKFRL